MTGLYSLVDYLKENLSWRKALQAGAFFTLGVSICAAQTTPTTRVEESNPGLSFNGAWAFDPSGIHSGNGALVADQSGARTFITFTGSGISWIGSTGMNHGVARVVLDGTVNTVDTFSATPKDQQAVFVAKGLTPGIHTMSIEVAPMKNINATGSAITIDAFDIANGAPATGTAVAGPGLIEQTNPAVSLTGSWYTNPATTASGGSAVMAMDAGSRATVNFNGTGITWIGFMDLWSGYARVYVDDVLTTTLDTWAMPWGEECGCYTWQRPIYTVSGLTNGPHTLTIEVTGQKSDLSGGNWVWVDAFKVAGPATAK